MPLFLRGDLLAGDRTAASLARARVGVGALSADRQPLAVAQTAVAAESHQALDVHGHFAAQIALDLVVAVDHFADAADLVLGQLMHALVERQPRLAHDLMGSGEADAVNILQRDHHALRGRDIDASDTRQRRTPQLRMVDWVYSGAGQRAARAKQKSPGSPLHESLIYSAPAHHVNDSSLTMRSISRAT